MQDVAVYHRAELGPGNLVPGPAVIAEDETTTVVPSGYVARINPLGSIILEKQS